MKKLTLILAIAFSVNVTAQVYVGVGTGLYVNKLHMAAELQLGCNYKTWVLQTGFHAPMDNTNPAFFEVKAGKQFNLNDMASIQVLAGAARQWFATGDEKLIRPAAGIEYIHTMFRGYWFAEIASFGSTTFATVGIKYTFRKHVQRWHGL